MQSLTTQRDDAYFPNANTFEVDRWIVDGGLSLGTPEMREMTLVWGKGSRVCRGQRLAVMEIKILLAKLIDIYAVRLAGEHTHGDMELTDHFTLIPRGKKCELVFSAV